MTSQPRKLDSSSVFREAGSSLFEVEVFGIMNKHCLFVYLFFSVLLFVTGCARCTSFSTRVFEYDDDLLISMLADRRQFLTDFGQRYTSPSYAAANALVHKGTNSVMAVSGALQNSNDPWVRRECAYILGQIRDHRAVDPLIAALKDPVGDVRMSAADALGSLRNSRAIEPLIAALKDDYVPVRNEAAIALRQFPSDPRIVEPLIALLKDNFTQDAAIGTLGEIHDPRVMSAMMRAFKALNPNAKEKAIDVFAEKLGAQAFDLVVLGADDKSPGIRIFSARAFNYRMILDPRVVEPLIRLSKDEDTYVRKEAIEALNRREKLLLENASKPDRAP